MTEAQAVALLGGRPIGGPAPEAWADLGCGDGVFTLALSTLLPSGSLVHAMDRDASALRQIPRVRGTISIRPHVGDFTLSPWPFDALDGVLLANSLHYVRDPSTFIDAIATTLKPRHRFVIVEYDTDRANAWVPYPLNRAALSRLFRAEGYSSVELLGSRPSRYQQAGMYAVRIESAGL